LRVAQLGVAEIMLLEADGLTIRRGQQEARTQRSEKETAQKAVGSEG